MIKILRKRRSIRVYQNHPIEPEKLEILKEACLRSPSSRNINPWEFIFITDSDLLMKLSRSKPHGAHFLEKAPLGVLICADEKKSDVWIEDCSIAAIILQLSAQSLSLGSCWIQIRNRTYHPKISAEQYIRRQLNMPRNIRIEAIVAIGYPAEKKPAISVSELSYNKIKINRY